MSEAALLFDPDALARAFWDGQPIDPKTLDTALARDIQEHADYQRTLSTLRRMRAHGIECPNSLHHAQRIWSWSIDLAHLALPPNRDGSFADHAKPLAALEALVLSSKRRLAVFAFAAWERGETERARAALQDLSPDSPTFDSDQMARAELALRAGEDPAALDSASGEFVRLKHVYLHQGPLALTRHMGAENLANLPHAVKAWLLDVHLGARDFEAARQLVPHIEASHLKIRFALACEDYAEAAARLSALPNMASPWLWTPQRHVQHLQTQLGLNALGESTQVADLHDWSTRALRLFPGHEGLNRLSLRIREMSEDWEGLCTDITNGELSDILPIEERAQSLARYGHPNRALDLLDAAPIAISPERAAWQRCLGAQFALRCGKPERAREILGPVPQLWPQRANHSYWAAEIALAERNTTTAKAHLLPVLEGSPTRMGHLLSAARCALFDGADALANSYLTRFNTMKTAQLGRPPEQDLRDLVIEDALKNAAPKASIAQAIRMFCHAAPAFHPTESTIPPTLAHYWEGPLTSPVKRGLKRWSQTNPQLHQTLFDAPAAQAWLAKNAPHTVRVFNALPDPATRADLFRMAYLAKMGGVFADLDEYPHDSVRPWLDRCKAVFVIEEGQGTLANNFMAVEPHSPLLHEVTQRILTRLQTTKTPYAWWDSGPAQLTLGVAAWLQRNPAPKGLRLLSQATYDTRVTTNLPFPHKRGPGHWRK